MNHGDIIEKDGRTYRVEFVELFSCRCCGGMYRLSESAYTHKAAIYKDALFCLRCIKDLWRNTPRYKHPEYNDAYTKRIRTYRVLCRLSRNQILPPDKCLELIKRVAASFRSSGIRFFDDDTYMAGWYKGKSLYQEGSELVLEDWIDFWEAAEKAKLTPETLLLAIINLMTGDKHAIHSATHRNPKNFWRRAAINAGNNTKHKGRGVGRKPSNGDGS